MDNTVRYLLYGVLAVVVINMLVTFFQPSHYKEIQQGIADSQKKIDAALATIQKVQANINGIKKDLNDFDSYLQRTGTEVAIMNKKKEIDDARIKGQVTIVHNKLNKQLDSLQHALDILPQSQIQN